MDTKSRSRRERAPVSSDREHRQRIALRSSIASSSSGGTSRRNHSCPARAKHDRLLSWSSVPPRAPLWLAVKSVLSLLCVMVGVLRAAGDALVDIRPDWKSLDDASGATVGEVFRSSEVLQMYHLQATAQLYEQGGLNHDMSFFLTGVAFYSVERPDVKVSIAYHPTNMTISLLPVISEDGRELRWDHQAASVSYVMGVDQAYWNAGSYMGETTGAFFSYAVEFSLEYHQLHPRYQPFSVYEDYPGREFLTASGCDEFVWALLSAAQTRGVRLTPALLPQKHKIVIYSHSKPEIIVFSGDGSSTSGGGNGDSDELAEGGAVPGEVGGGSSSSSSNNSSSGGGEAGASSWSSSLPTSSGDSDAPPVREEEEGHASGSGGGSSSSSMSPSVDDIRNKSSSSSSTGQEGQEEDGDGSSAGGEERQRLLRGRTLLWGSPGSDSAGNAGEAGALDQEAGEPEDEGTEEPGVTGVDEAEATGAPLSTVSPTEAAVQTHAPAAEPTEEWQEVVGYYQSLQLCLQERKFSFVTSLKDFVRYFDCLDDVAFIAIGPHEYYKVNITSTKLDHISLPEELPEVKRRYESFTRVDTALAVWILMIIACGIHGVLWQAAVIQHWLKSYGNAQVEEEPLEGSDDSAEPERPPSLTRKITTQYLRVGQLLLGKAEDDFLELSPSSAPAKDATAACCGAAASGGGPGDADSSGGGGSNGLPRRQRSPKRGGAFRNGAPRDRDDGGGAGGSRRRQGPARGGGRGAAEEEKGLEMRDTSGQPKGGRWGEEEEEEEEEEGEDGAFVGSASGAGRHRAGAENIPPSSPSSSTSSVPQGIMAHERGVRVWSGAGRAYGSGGGERWIGFAGSPRNRRPPVRTAWDDERGTTTAAAGGEDERLGNGNGNSQRDPLAASSPSATESGRRKDKRNGSRSRSRSTSPEALGVAKQGDSSSGGEESATFFKEEDR
ncbi:unnamed protein product [Ectocarpus sp. 4 AP-2014]